MTTDAHGGWGRAVRFIVPPDLISGDRVGGRRFTVHRTTLSGWWALEFTSPRVVVAAAAGRCDWSCGAADGSLAAEPALFDTRTPVAVGGEDTETVALSLDRAELTRYARAVYADDALPLRFDGARPVSPAAGRRCIALVSLALAKRDLLAEPIIAAAFHRTLALAVLESFRLTGEPVRRRATAAGMLRAYEAGARFIDDCASLPITTVDVAQAAGVPEAQLAAAFRAHDPSRRTPAGYLKATRHDAVRAAMQRGDAGAHDGAERRPGGERRLASRWDRWRVRASAAPSRGHPPLDDGGAPRFR